MNGFATSSSLMSPVDGRNHYRHYVRDLLPLSGGQRSGPAWQYPRTGALTCQHAASLPIEPKLDEERLAADRLLVVVTNQGTYPSSLVVIPHVPSVIASLRDSKA